MCCGCERLRTEIETYILCEGSNCKDRHGEDG